jgi:2-polyprenyl-6-methoxyphenol hydroxylase-like FAD-dependent oxidoreductase
MKVLISGSGIAGLTLALLLERYGHEVLVIERSAHLRGEGYMIDFIGPGYEASERMGILPEIEGIHYQIPRLAVLGPSGKEKFSLSYPTLRNLFGDRQFNFMRGDLERLLYSKIENRIKVRFATSVNSLEQDGAQVRVKLTDGTTDSFDLLVGADGVHSRVRELAFGAEDSFSRFMGYYTAAFVMEDAKKIRESLGDAFYTLTVPGRQVAVYPIGGGRLATFFIHKAERLLEDFSPEAVREELRKTYGEMGWIVPKLLEGCPSGPGLYFDKVTQIEVPTWSRGAVVLVGDACWCVSLLAGQGASMAVSGAYTLAEELGAAQEEGKEEIAAALGRYEAKLKPAVQKRQKAGRRVAKWFVPSDPVRLMVRDTVLRMATSSLVSVLLRSRFALGKTP